MKTGNAKIAEYFDATMPYYRTFWHRGTNALHYGFWDEHTKSVKDALIRTNAVLAEIAGITSKDNVLDAGCGVGGSALWLASHTGATVRGITLSPQQRDEATRLAEQENLGKLVRFEIGDYLRTGFADESFDVVWAVESVCYAEEKRDFLREAYRILKPGGRLVIADGFLKRDPVNDVERRDYKYFLDGLALANLAKNDSFKEAMTSIGFRKIAFFDKTQEILPSSRRLYFRCLAAYPFFRLANLIGIVPDIVMKNGPAGIAQWKLVRSGVGGYSVFYGEK